MSSDEIIRQAARWIAIDPTMASDLMEVSIAQHQDEHHLREIGKMARKRLRELARVKPRRQPRWNSYGAIRKMMELTSNQPISFYRDVTRSSPEKNGIYRLTIAPPITGSYYPLVTLTQPDGTSLVHGRQMPPGATMVAAYGNQQLVNGYGVLYLTRLSTMMRASLIASKEAFASFFNLGAPADWTLERVRYHLAYGQTWVPSQKISAYDESYLRKLPLFANLRKTLPASMSDRDVLGTVREALVREQEAFRAAEAARAEARLQAPTEAAQVAQDASSGDDDYVDDEGDYEGD